MAVRLSQTAREGLHGAQSRFRASQIVVEVAIEADGKLRVSQTVVECLVSIKSRTRVSQTVREVLYQNPALVSQVVVERLVQTSWPPVFPDLVGRALPVVRRADWKTGLGVAGSGRTIRLPFATWPVWEWDIEHDVLQDGGAFSGTASDFRTLIGFFLAQAGGFKWFCFRDPVFNAVAGAQQMVGDGTTASYVLSYTAGIGTQKISEPIGFLDLATLPVLYLDGVAQPSLAWSVDRTVPHNQVMTLVEAPTVGVAVAVDMSFYYAVRFADDTLDFEEFMAGFWTQKKLTLQSVLG